jgi:protein-L-isoaspartate(D-aspartate) O-methyltransferase
MALSMGEEYGTPAISVVVVKSPDDRRRDLVARLSKKRVISRPEVVRAFATVPRHGFLTASYDGIAYDDRAVVIKCDETDRPLSSASQPSMMGQMLEQLAVRPGDRLLEIGTGSGYNAALLAELTGPDGAVTTVEIEDDLAAAAAASLRSNGYGAVTVVVGDGRDGYPPGAPYDAVIVTAGAGAVEESWTSQLAEGGRLVVPLVDQSGVGVAVLFEKVQGQLVRRSERPCGFLALRHG